MKLINPAGRKIETFNTEVYSCMCSNDSLENRDIAEIVKKANHSSGLQGNGCQCSHGPVNRDANYNHAN